MRRQSTHDVRGWQGRDLREGDRDDRLERTAKTSQPGLRRVGISGARALSRLLRDSPGATHCSRRDRHRRATSERGGEKVRRRRGARQRPQHPINSPFYLKLASTAPIAHRESV